MRFGPPLFWLGVSLWVGGLAALAVAAPVIFRSAPSRESAGLLFGQVLRSFGWVEMGCALLAAGGLALSWNRDFVRGGLLAAMMALLIVFLAWILPSMEALRPEIAASEPARARFQSLHRLSEHLYKLKLLAGLALILVSAWKPKS
jgi:hypothetical protein